MNKRTLSVCGAAMFLSMLVSSAWGYEKEIEELSAKMATKIADKGKKTVAVVDFTDLKGNVTQLDQFIAEEFSVALAGSSKGFRVIDRTRLKSIIKENKLAAAGLIDPATASKLGKIAGVDALVTGTLTPFGDTVHLTVKVLDSNTADVIDSAKSDIAKTPAINELLGKEVEPVRLNSGTVQKMEEKPIPQTAKSTLRMEKEGVLFELLECRLNGTTVNCSLLITNKGGDRNFSVGTSYETSMFDTHGKKYADYEMKFDNHIERNSCISLRFIPGAKLEMTVSFYEVKMKENSIPILELGVSIDHFSRVSFNNVPLLR